MRPSVKHRRPLAAIAALSLFAAIRNAAADGSPSATDEVEPATAGNRSPTATPVAGEHRAGVGVGLAPDERRADTPFDPTHSADERTTERPKRRNAALGAATALFPGAIVHGTGHLVGGDTKTGTRLLALEGAGLGILATGFAPIVFTGASRRLIGPAIGLTVVGVGLFAVSFLADVYGVVAPEGGLGAPSGVAPSLQTSLGYRYVYNPAFAFRNFLVAEIEYRTGPFRIHPSGWFALDDTNSRLRSEFAYRLAGPMPAPAPRTADGSHFDVTAAVMRHAFTSNRFATTSGEIAVGGRLDLARIGPSLRGSFAEMSLGWALQAHAYQARGTTADVRELLLARFGFGMYLGWLGSPRGEVSVFYDHRHDGFAAGMKMTGLGSGVIGHFGAQGRVYVDDHWGLAAEFAAGSAYVTGLSVLFRQGDPR